MTESSAPRPDSARTGQVPPGSQSAGAASAPTSSGPRDPAIGVASSEEVTTETTTVGHSTHSTTMFADLDPPWTVPSPYGAPLAVQSLSTVAAPLLAGFSVTLAGVVMQATDKFRWPGLGLLLLAVAAVLLLFCVQCGFWARHELAFPEEVVQWWPDFRSSPDRRSRVAEEQRRRYQSYRQWADSARRAYNCAIVALLAGVAVTLIPVENGWDSVMRWCAAGVFGLAALGEIIWSMRTSH